jgi:hypothetical protein
MHPSLLLSNTPYGPLQAFSRSYDLALRHRGRLRKRDNLLTGEGGVGEEPNHTTTKKAWASMNHSVPSAPNTTPPPQKSVV